MNKSNPARPKCRPNLGNEIIHTLSANKNKICFIDAQTNKKYIACDILKKIEDIKQNIAQAGIKKKEIVLINATNCVDYLCWFLSLSSCEIIVAEAVPEWPKQIYNDSLQLIKPNWILNNDDSDSFLLSKYSDHKSTQSRNTEFLAFTSGTTGTLKAAMLHSVGHLHVANEVINELQISNTDMIGTNLPWQHGYGKSVLMSALLAGATFVHIPNSIFPNSIWKYIETYQVTIFSGVPTQFRGYIKSEIAKPSSLRLVCIAAGSLHKSELLALSNRLGNSCKIIPMYGLTEMHSRVSISPSSASIESLSNGGKPISGVKVKIDHENSNEILVAGPNMMNGYWNNKNETKEVMTNEWLRTGDCGELDGSGYLWISSRKKELIKKNGKILYPKYLEDAVRNIPSVQDVALIGIAKSSNEDQIILFIESHEIIPSNILNEKIVEILGPTYLPDKIIFLKEFPRGYTGKVLKKTLYSRYEMSGQKTS